MPTLLVVEPKAKRPTSRQAKLKNRLKKIDRSYGGSYTVFFHDQKAFRPVNAAIPVNHRNPHEPVAPLASGICEVCSAACFAENGYGLAYTELMQAAAQGIKRCICDECRSDLVALNAERVEQECGIDLGGHGLGRGEQADCLSRDEIKGLRVIQHRGDDVALP